MVKLSHIYPVVFIAACVMPAVSYAQTPKLSIRSLQTGTTVRGTVELEVATDVPFNLLRVQYFLNGHPLYQPVFSAPFRLAWSTFEVWDGPQTLRAEGTAADGKTLVEAQYAIRNNQRNFLKVTLPLGAAIWSASLAGKPVRPGQAPDGSLLLPLEKARQAIHPDQAPFLDWLLAHLIRGERGASAP